MIIPAETEVAETFNNQAVHLNRKETSHPEAAATVVVVVTAAVADLVFQDLPAEIVITAAAVVHQAVDALAVSEDDNKLIL